MTKYLHRGDIIWQCDRCAAFGSEDFEFEDDNKVPLQDGYIPVLANGEATHSLTGCSGTVQFVVAQRTTVQGEKKAS